MGFRRGDAVEVASKETGFEGSYYEAIVVQELPKREYVVQYKNLVKDDFSGPLLEKVEAEELRPVPSKIPTMEFGLGEMVDAFDNDGWWVGEISGKFDGNYVVYFDASSKDEFVYQANRLRLHQDWINGKYCLSSLYN